MIGRVSVQGDKDLAKALNALGEKVKKKQLERALLEAGEPLRQRMADLAPRGDIAPHIADHIVMMPVSKVQGVRLHEDQAAVAIGPEKSFFYGWFLEFGLTKARDMDPQPFVRPAFDHSHQGVLSRLRGVIWNLLKGSAR